MEKRETFQSRLGFLLLSAGCAIGIGNVWKFPYMVGQNGGAVFVLLYLFFLVVMGVPVLSMEFAVGRASRKSPVKAYQELEKSGQKWHLHGYLALLGNYLLMMFYTTVAGWMLSYFFKFVAGEFSGKTPDEVGTVFGNTLASPVGNVFWMVVTIVIGIVVCSMGLQQGVEKITKFMMLGLLFLMMGLAGQGLFLEGGMEGLKFYLLPDFQKAAEVGWLNLISAAMNQAFFTLSLGIGSMAIFGSYLGKENSLLGESINVAALDTFVANYVRFNYFSSLFCI